MIHSETGNATQWVQRQRIVVGAVLSDTPMG
jgi:hypothetical protein